MKCVFFASTNLLMNVYKLALTNPEGSYLHVSMGNNSTKGQEMWLYLQHEGCNLKPFEAILIWTATVCVQRKMLPFAGCLKQSRGVSKGAI